MFFVFVKDLVDKNKKHCLVYTLLQNKRRHNLTMADIAVETCRC
jgi:hypothetical protein